MTVTQDNKHLNQSSSSKQLLIIQCAREITSGGGVNGVAYNLEVQLQKLGYMCNRFTIEDIGIKESLLKTGLFSNNFYIQKLKVIRDILCYSIFGTYQFQRRKLANSIVICHSDMLYGDIFVVHGVHKSYIANRDRQNKIIMLLRNPIHLMILFREEIRYHFKVHKQIIALSEGVKKDLIHYYSIPETCITVIPNGVDLKRFKRNDDARQKIRTELRIAPNTFVFIFVGHEFRRKGLRFAIEAIRALILQGKRVDLIVAGRDSPSIVKSSLEDIEKYIHFVGARKNIEEYYSAADAFVFPTEYEAFPLVALEAMSAGLPIISTKVHGVEDFMKEGISGYYARRDSADFAAKMKQIIEDEIMYKKMMRNVREVAESYSWENIAKRYEGVIHQVALKKLQNSDLV